MKILLLTDIHAGTDTNYPNRKGSEYTNIFGGKLDSSREKLRMIVELLDLVVNLGDFIHETSLEADWLQYAKGMQILAGLGKPVIHVAGNHDLVYLDRDELKRLWGTEHLYCYRDIGGYRHIVLDGNRDGNKNGIIERNQPYRFDEEQIEWLRRVLSGSDIPCIVYSHFLLDNQDVSSNYYWEGIPDSQSRAFPLRYLEVREIIEDSGKVIAVFSGHTHFRHEEKIKGIHYINVGSFAENDGTGKATGEYVIANIDEGEFEVQFNNI